MNSENDVVDKALDLGTTYFKTENYSKAKEVFKKAFRLVRSYDENQLRELRRKWGLETNTESNTDGTSHIYHPKYVRILDNLAATYEKLGDLNTALKYAQRMTKVEPDNIKTYIRLGKVLQKLERDQDALEIYKRALGRVKDEAGRYRPDVSPRFITIVNNQVGLVEERLRNDKSSRKLTGTVETPGSEIPSKRQYLDPIKERHRLLKRSRKDTQEQRQISINKKAALDFVNILPHEVSPVIFRQFQTKELMGFTLVSKTWREIILHTPSLFSVFILNRKSYRDVLKYCYFLHSLYLKSSKKFNGPPIELIKFSSKTPSEELKCLEALLRTLQDLKLRRFILSTPSCNTAQYAKYFSKSTVLSRNLEEFSAVLTLRQDKPYEFDMLKSFQHLRKLDILLQASVIPLNCARSPSIESDIDESWAQKIESFRLICNQNKVRTFPFLALFSKLNTNNLCILCITGVQFDRSTNQFDWICNFKFLTELWLENNQNATFSSFMRLLRDYPLSARLSKLTFREDSIMSRFDLEEISESYFYRNNFKSLSCLDIMGTSVSGLGLTRIVSYLEQTVMKKINFGDCPFINIHRLPSDANPAILSPFNLFSVLPGLEEISLPQLGTLNDQGIAAIRLAIHNLEQLKRVDLSLNPAITGVAVYDLLKDLKNSRSNSLEYLNLDGCVAVSHITINTLKSQGLVRRVDCAYEREIWRKFGVNSYKYQS